MELTNQSLIHWKSGRISISLSLAIYTPPHCYWLLHNEYNQNAVGDGEFKHHEVGACQPSLLTEIERNRVDTVTLISYHRSLVNVGGPEQ